ncbi:MAG: GreA/GreB family elongation factor [Patescibacteria group bacterium]|jgi:transcription elongation GreA/GreB family factor
MEVKKVSKDYYQALEKRVKDFEERIQLLQRLALKDKNLGVDTSFEIGEEKILQRQLRRAKADLRSVQAVANPKDNGVVQVGSTVTVQVNGSAYNLRLEGVAFCAGVITTDAPLGKKLLGKSKGAVINIEKNRYQILAVTVKSL